jgi:hypothetical protein
VRLLRRPLAAFAVLLASIAVLLGGSAGPALAQSGEQIQDYDVTITVERDGTMRIDELITYDFGPNERRGILRDLVVREAFDTTYERVYRIDNIQVRTEAGTPGDVSVTDEGNYRRIRIGDPDVFIRGVHRYAISYTVEGGPRSFDDHDELFWDAIGNQWNVPVANASATVVVPAPVDQILCFTGAQGATLGCDGSSFEGATATFTHAGLDEFEGMTVVVGMAPGTFQPPAQPLLDELWTPAFGFQATPVRGGLAGIVGLVGLVGVPLLAWRKGRDRAYVGSAVDQALGNTTGEEQRRGFGRLQAGTVEFVPPEGIRPGQLGTLIDEQANLLDVTSTIVDLAVRGWLRIVEIPKAGGWTSKTDYELQKPGGQGKGKLHTYEQMVLDSLFAGRSTVKLSELKYTWRPELSKIQNALYNDLVEQGWYRSRPDHTRIGWRILGIVLLAVGVVGTFVLMTFGWGLVGLALAVTGLMLTSLAGKMPARTGRGTAMLSRSLGFKRLFTEGLEDARSRFAEEKGIFSEYLPFAIVFGCTDRWAKAFEGLGAEQLGTMGGTPAPTGSRLSPWPAR